jgi:hypothetical protein
MPRWYHLLLLRTANLISVAMLVVAAIIALCVAADWIGHLGWAILGTQFHFSWPVSLWPSQFIAARQGGFGHCEIQLRTLRDTDRPAALTLRDLLFEKVYYGFSKRALRSDHGVVLRHNIVLKQSKAAFARTGWGPLQVFVDGSFGQRNGSGVALGDQSAKDDPAIVQVRHGPNMRQIRNQATNILQTAH